MVNRWHRREVCPLLLERTSDAFWLGSVDGRFSHVAFDSIAPSVFVFHTLAKLRVHIWYLAYAIIGEIVNVYDRLTSPPSAHGDTHDESQCVNCS